MDVDSIKRIRNTLSRILSQDNGSGWPESNNGEFVQDQMTDEGSNTFDLKIMLPTFSLLKTLGIKKAELLKLESDQILKPQIKQLERIQSIVASGVDLSAQVLNCLEFMHDSCQIIEQALRDPLAQDALPLPHDLHRKMVDMVDACIWMIENRRWSLLENEVDWEQCLSKLKEEVTDWVLSSKRIEKNFSEFENLKIKLESVMQNCSQLKREKFKV